MNELPRVSDVSAAGSCAKLTEFGMENMHQVRDLDFLSNCRSLGSVLLENVEIDDLDFVESLGRAYGAGLSIGGRVGDWSGLSRCSSFGELRIRPENGSVAAILPYLQDCVVSNLEISNARDLDLAALPKITGTLNLSDCPNVEDLSALSDDHSFLHLFLSRMSRLRSLDGLEKNTFFGRADSGSRCELWIDNCPRLEDWSALDGKMLAEIRLANVYSLPDFGALQYSARALLRLENIPGVTDLGFLDAVAAPEKSYFSFELVDLDELSDISALRRFRGEYLAVMPALEAQAQALVESKNFGRCDIAYPSGGWNGGYDSFTLLSLDELDTLSDAALSRVTSLSLAGDQLVDRSRYDVWNEWDGAKQRVYLVDRDSGERTEVTVGGYTDLSALSKLTGLRQLELCALPIESLEGIQAFAELEQLRVRDCPRLSDASAAFTLQNLRFIELGRCPIGSIMGVQNCTELCGLSIYETDVKDLSPLRELDYGAAIASGGFSLSVGVTDCEDYSPIEAVPALSDLDLNGVKYEKWPDLSRVGELRSLSAHGDELSQEAFEELLRAHPELEELQIPWSREIRDLTPLLGMEKLRRVVVSRDMEEAVATLDGTDCSFELEIFD